MPEQESIAALLLGSNLGEREKNLELAISKLARAGQIIKISSIYVTAPWGLEEQPDYLNQALLLRTGLPPQKLLSEILSIEKEMGRVREQKWGPRIIDIDILYYGQQVVNEENLQIPHPFLPDRRFSLLPLAEINPQWKHPNLHMSVTEMLERCPDEGEVRKYKAEKDAI